jgi:hypothetical protein
MSADINTEMSTDISTHMTIDISTDMRTEMLLYGRCEGGSVNRRSATVRGLGRDP